MAKFAEDPLLLEFSVLYNFWGANFQTFDGGIVTGLATQFLKLAEETVSYNLGIMVGYSAATGRRLPDIDWRTCGRGARILIAPSLRTIL